MTAYYLLILANMRPGSEYLSTDFVDLVREQAGCDRRHAMHIIGRQLRSMEKYRMVRRVTDGNGGGFAEGRKVIRWARIFPVEVE